jgi:hypothetical protein
MSLKRLYISSAAGSDRLPSPCTLLWPGVLTSSPLSLRTWILASFGRQRSGRSGRRIGGVHCRPGCCGLAHSGSRLGEGIGSPTGWRLSGWTVVNCGSRLDWNFARHCLAQAQFQFITCMCVMACCAAINLWLNCEAKSLDWTQAESISGTTRSGSISIYHLFVCHDLLCCN